MMDSHRDEIAKLESLYASNPEGRVFTHLAEACRKAGQLERAREILEDGLRRHPDYASAHVVLGRVMTDSGDPGGAAQEFRRVLELDRHNLVALRSLGDLARADDRADEALYYYGELAVLDPTDGGIQEEIRRLRTQIAVTPAPRPSPAPAETPQALEEQGEPGVAEVAGSADTGEAADRPAGWSVMETAGSESAAHPEVEPMAGLESAAVSQEEVAEVPETPAAAVAPEPSVAEDTEGRPDSAWDLGAGAWPRVSATKEEERRADLGDSGEWIPAERWEWMAASADAESPPEVVTGSGEPEAAPEPAEESVWPAASAGDEEEYEPEPLALDAAGAVTEIAATYEVTEYVTQAVPLSPESEEEAAGDYGLTDDDDEGDQVITETLAEIYATQGLFERAAAVYRRLVRQRPADERLAARLRELERSPGWGVTTHVEPDTAPLTIEDTGSGEAWLERVESAWTGGEGAVAADESPYAWPSERGAEEQAGQRVGDYFRSLLAWRPGQPGAAPVTTEPARGTLDADPATEFDRWFGGRDIGPTEPAGGEPGRTGGEGDEDLEMFRSWLKSLKK